MKKLNILWTSDNLYTIRNMIAMYSVGSLKAGNWDEINIIMWGASVRLAGISEEAREQIKRMLDAGVHLEACQACSEDFGSTKVLQDLGVTTRYMRQPLTDYIQSGENILTV